MRASLAVGKSVLSHHMQPVVRCSARRSFGRRERRPSPFISFFAVTVSELSRLSSTAFIRFDEISIADQVSISMPM